MSNKHVTKTEVSQGAGWPFLPALQMEFNQLLDRFDGLRAEVGSRLVPAIDMSETDDAVEVTAEVPGLSPDEIDVSIVDDRLVLKGGHDEKREESGKDWRMVERRSGSFRRVVPLGFSPDSEGMKAKLADGVLHLTITKPSDAKTKARKVKIEAA
ncbi:heat shock protein Hsp20 [Jannaschia faecimaris]|uniref:Heat shock protein Hsp20 n=1 Tax=Jannaschia faecimaris TaxID=1244108 RepID=A0A1H3SQ97_9RHOB|nr:Hsp20/alpha crystallin family protein [Jannaschia faecimaris]SDZ40253.1 heat shock protein Hsp20 [Jannaschia faecimaris]